MSDFMFNVVVGALIAVAVAAALTGLYYDFKKESEELAKKWPNSAP